MTHSEVEATLWREGLELLRQLFQAHLNARSPGEAQGPVVGADAVERPHVDRGTERGLMSIFGPVRVYRAAYTQAGQSSLYPLEGQLNLPLDVYSFGVRKRVAQEAAKGSFDEVVESIPTTTGAAVAKRQVEELTVRAATDFDAFYETRRAATAAQAAASGALLVMSVDGQGIVMRKEDLREATRKAAEARQHKLHTRLSRGEKRNAKRMATVAAVYTLPPWVRTPEEIVGELQPVRHCAAGRPRPEAKRVWASVEKTPQRVLEAAFEEARRRDPTGRKRWVALVDGNKTPLKILRRLARRHGVELLIILDLIHVLEYLWKAAWVFHEEGSKDAEGWVRERLRQILQGHRSDVAAGIRRSATLRQLSARQRKAADRCADYLLRYRRYLHYDAYLAAGLPIATGVIEGACRYLVKDRMDLTGARWGLQGAEAVLKVRSLRASGDFEAYWSFHQQQECQRNHKSKYANNTLPPIRNPRLELNPKGSPLRVVE
jgi:hypothetical protein